MVKQANIFECDVCGTQHPTLDDAEKCEYRCLKKHERETAKAQALKDIFTAPRLTAKTLVEFINKVESVLKCDLKIYGAYESYSAPQLAFNMAWEDLPNPFATDTFDRKIGSRVFEKFGIHCYTASSTSMQAYINLADFPQLAKTLGDYTALREHDAILATDLEGKYAQLVAKDEYIQRKLEQIQELTNNLNEHVDYINDAMREEFQATRKLDYDLKGSFKLHHAPIDVKLIKVI